MKRIELMTAIVVVLAGAWVEADTLILRDGRRVQGVLLGMRNGVIEFREARGVLGVNTRTVRFDRDEVRRIEIDEASPSSFDDDEPRDSNRSPTTNDGDRAGGRPRGLREREVAVAAAVQWNDTGVEVRAGQSVYFTSSGRSNWGPGRRDGAAGEGNSPRNPGRPIPNRPGAALIGRVGDQDPFFIGDEEGAIRVRSAGRLFLGINDDYLVDNSGGLRVTVYY